MPKEGYRINERFDNEDMNKLTRLANRSFARLERRLDSIEKVNAQIPPSVKNFAVDGKQGIFHISWQKIIGVNGYIILMAEDAAMIKITNRFDIPGQETCTWSVSQGNVVLTRYFQLFSYLGNKHSNGSVIQSATTVTYGAAESAPTPPVFDPSRPGAASARFA